SPASSEAGGSQSQTGPERIVCEGGDLEGDLTVAMVGDSKVIQWQSAIEQIANDQGWHVYSYIKSACAFSTGVQVAKGDPYTSCEGWNEQVLPLILDQQPDVVIVSNRIATAMAHPPDTD